MAKIDVTYTPEEIREYATRDFVISSQITPVTNIASSPSDNYCYLQTRRMDSALYAEIRTQMCNCLNRYANDGNRKIGLIIGILDDGSFNLAILGDGQVQMGYRGASTMFGVCSDFPLQQLDNQTHMIDAGSSQFGWSRTYMPAVANKISGFAFIDYPTSPSSDRGIEQDTAIMYTPQWQILSGITNKAYSENLLRVHGKINSSAITTWNQRLQLTRSKFTTLVIGDATRQFTYTNSDSLWCKNGYRNIGGALYAIASENALLHQTLNGLSIISDDVSSYRLDLAEVTTGTYAAHYIPFNLILTRNEQEALRYLDTGELPSDAFIYPFDVDNIPTNTSGEDPDSGGGGGTPSSDVSPDEDGTPADDTDPMPTDTPSYSPLRLTNNNLYWLSASDLRQFINWFWTDATDVESWSDLLDKIMGLYENLSQAIINIRYMPVMSSWIGTLGTDTKIIVGMLEKQHAVNTIAKASTPIRDIGSYKIEPKFNDSFCNYSPYSTISIYLPFHGMVELDNDLIMGHKIYVRCAYDILAGTIQYFIHRDSNDGSLIYSTVAKMAVDIPITLQTKTDRDSAIFQNVGSVVGGLVGAGASLAGGSPIGLTMGLANMSGFQPSSAPLRVTGNVSESGAFYAPTKCAIYIKRPAYNRPELYKSRVGFPCNYSYKLSECSGFTTCYKPRINFSGVEYTENNTTVTIKPTHSEIEMIYDYLEKGVII